MAKAKKTSVEEIALIEFEAMAVSEVQTDNGQQAVYFDWITKSAIQYFKLDDVALAAKFNSEHEAMMLHGDELAKAADWFKAGLEVANAAQARLLIAAAKAAA